MSSPHSLYRSGEQRLSTLFRNLQLSFSRFAPPDPATTALIGSTTPPSLILIEDADESPLSSGQPQDHLAPPPCHLLSLPNEVLIRVAEQLDRSSAKSLSLTSRTLQPIAEAGIWSEIIFALVRPRPSVKKATAPDSNKNLIKAPPVRFRKNRHKRLYLRFMEMLGEGEERNRKLAALRSADLTVYGSIRPLMVELIRLIAPRLMELTLRGNLFDTNKVPGGPRRFCIRANPLIQFPRLTSLAICHLEIDLVETLLPLLDASPDLRALRLEGFNSIWWRDPVPPATAAPGKQIKLYPTLIDLRIQHSFLNGIPPIVFEALLRARNLELFSQEGPPGCDAGPLGPLLGQLGLQAGLRELHWITLLMVSFA